MENHNQDKKTSLSKSIMGKNVTQFQHFLKQSYINEDDISWAINLRAYPERSKQAAERQESSAPQVAFKKTVAQTEKERKGTQPSPKFNSMDFEGFLSKKNTKGKKQNISSLCFYATLRESGLEGVNHKTLFSSIPLRERNEPPRILKKENYKKIGNISANDKDSALDGAQNYPVYTEKILRTKNVGLLKSFSQAGGRARISLPGLAWQVGLRDY